MSNIMLPLSPLSPSAQYRSFYYRVACTCSYKVKGIPKKESSIQDHVLGPMAVAHGGACRVFQTAPTAWPTVVYSYIVTHTAAASPPV